jgi:hypothetical protein
MMHVSYIMHSCDTCFLVINFSYFLFVAVSEHELTAADLLMGGIVSFLLVS